MINILFNHSQINDPWCFDTFRKYIHPDDKVTVIPFSFQEQFIDSERSWQAAYGKDQGYYYSQIVEPFLSYGIDEQSISWVNYFSDTKTEAKQKIEEADILYFPGGLPDKMMERIIEFDLKKIIQQHRGVVMGFSAGAMIQMSDYHITPDEDYESFGYFKGLGLIHSFDLEVHFKSTQVQLDCINRSIRETGRPVYAMEDEGALIVVDGKVATIGKVHYFE
ncbi:Type 1 glutamine amidotransferase-like domain-containing protein [Sporolactobacillus sp. STCC-11]|uniref:Type 1 glutamine amidotransferase-like domain-containing protein n=1 Tax=Sporolactobacillus caesalpiniae TaxID=3230362 RepID=UPI00339B0D96